MNEAYVVSEATKKLWKVELDLLQKFTQICSKYGLKWYAIGGTLLGAARHQGFIPWDDDIDIGMPYEDYRVFLELAKRECVYPYYLHCHLTDPANGGIMNARLRRSDTTGVTQWEYDNIGSSMKIPYNMGIWIDIFPLCNIPETLEEKENQKTSIMEMWKAVRGYNALESQKNGRKSGKTEYNQYINDYEVLSKYLTIGEIKSLYVDRCGMIKRETTMIGVTSYRTFAPRFMWKAEWFRETCELPFEDTKIICPKYYDEVLTTTYNDWRTPVYNAGCHEMYAFDPEIAYTDYFKLT